MNNTIGRVIFLDIDGVLNAVDKYDFITTFPAPGMRMPFVVDLNRVMTLNHVLTQTPWIKVVVSSTWRLSREDLNYTVNNVKDFCKATRLDRRIFHEDWRTNLIGDGENRAAEVSEWLERHPEVFKVAVIDDNYSDQFKSEPSFRFVRTNPQVGMTFNDLDNLMRKGFGVRVRHDLSVTTAGGPIP